MGSRLVTENTQALSESEEARRHVRRETGGGERPPSALVEVLNPGGTKCSSGPPDARNEGRLEQRDFDREESSGETQIALELSHNADREEETPACRGKIGNEYVHRTHFAYI